MKNIKILILLFLAILLFQSYGGGILKFNFTPRHSFTEGFMAFWRPCFLMQVYANFLYPIFAVGYLIIMVKFIRRVKFTSWQFVFLLIVCITLSIIETVNAMTKVRDILIPIILLGAFNENSNISIYN
jgi:hypothetical protein